MTWERLRDRMAYERDMARALGRVLRGKGTPEQVRAFDEARRALEENGERERKAGIREETEPYHRLNSRVLETERPLSPWQRSYFMSDLREVRTAWQERRAGRRSR